MNRNKRTKIKSNKPRLKIIRWVMISCLCIFGYEILVRYTEPKLLPIRHVKIDSQYELIDLKTLKQHIAPRIKGFFSTNVMALKKNILEEPFVDEVVIRRVWPDTLSVTLVELKLIASWGNEAAVSSRGDIVPVKVDPHKKLPVFFGQSCDAKIILEQYRELSTILQPFNLAISEINLNPRHSWQISLDNGIKILLGRKDVSDHLIAFASVYPKLKKIHGDNIEAIDLRHSNGISVNLLHRKIEEPSEESLENKK